MERHARAEISTPRVFAKERWWPSDEVARLTSRVYSAAVSAVGSDAPLVAVVVPPSVEGIAMVLAASALRGTMLLLPPEPRAWRSDPAIPEGTPFLLSPAVAHLAPAVEQTHGRACVLDLDADAGVSPVKLLQTAGMVWLTSGTTGLPKPVFRNTASILSCVDQRLSTLPLPEGVGVATGDSLAHGQGLVEFLLSCRVQGAFAPLEPLNMRATLAVLAMPEFGVWFTTPQIAELLSRCALDGPPVAPPLCFVAGQVSRKTAAAFRARYGRSLRQHYGSSEGGPVGLENAADDAIRAEAVGRRVHGVEICIGARPDACLPAGEIGRIWLRSPGQMTGYGFPPDLDRSEIVDGWLPTRDLGALGDDGYLTLAGRMDDCVRVRDGRLVNLALVATRLREVDGVSDAIAVSIDLGTGPTVGAMVEGSPLLDSVRQQISLELPPWCWPRQLIAVPQMPRLANGKIDLAACRDLLSGARAS